MGQRQCLQNSKRDAGAGYRVKLSQTQFADSLITNSLPTVHTPITFQAIRSASPFCSSDCTLPASMTFAFDILTVILQPLNDDVPFSTPSNSDFSIMVTKYNLNYPQSIEGGIKLRITSLVCGMAHSAPLLIVARFLQGIGGGAMLICQIAVLSQQFKVGKERAWAFSIWGMVFGAGLGFGPIIGSLIMAVFNWKWVFLIHVPLTALALTFEYYGVRESSNPEARELNIPGILLLSATVAPGSG
jgi:hypothetical protein